MENNKKAKFFVYILRTDKNTFYVGQTKDPKKRLKEHQGIIKGGAKYTRAFGAAEIVYTESFETRSAAMKREYQLKKLTREEKMEIAGLIQ